MGSTESDTTEATWAAVAAEAFNGYGVSVLQDEFQFCKPEVDGCWWLSNNVNVLNAPEKKKKTVHLKVVKMVNFMSYLFHHNKNCYPQRIPLPHPQTPWNWNQYRETKHTDHLANILHSHTILLWQGRESSGQFDFGSYTLDAVTWISNLQSLLYEMNGHYLRVLVRARRRRSGSSQHITSAQSTVVMYGVASARSRESYCFIFKAQPVQIPPFSVKPAIACRMAHQPPHPLCLMSGTVMQLQRVRWCFFFKSISFKIFIYLAALGLSCGTQDLDLCCNVCVC